MVVQCNFDYSESGPHPRLSCVPGVISTNLRELWAYRSEPKHRRISCALFWSVSLLKLSDKCYCVRYLTLQVQRLPEPHQQVHIVNIISQDHYQSKSSRLRTT